MNGVISTVRRELGSFAGPGVTLLLASGVAAVLGYVFWFVLARQVAAFTLGEVSTVVSIVAGVALLATAGLAPTAALSTAALSPEERPRVVTVAAGVGAALGAALGVGVVVASWVVAPAWVLSTSTFESVAFVVACAATALAGVLDAIHNALRTPVMVLLRTVVTGGVRVLAIVAVLAVLSAPVDVTAVLVIWSLAAVAGVLPQLVGLARNGMFTGGSTNTGVRSLLAGLQWQQITTVASQLPAFVLPVIVAARGGAEAAAGFFLAWQLAGGCFMAQTAVTPTLLVRTAANPTSHGQMFRDARRLLSWLITPLMVGVVALGPFVLGVLGASYTSATVILMVLVVAALPDAVAALHITRWRALGRERIAAVFNTVTGCAVVGGAWLLIPVFGSVAAAWVFAGVRGAAALAASMISRRTVTTNAATGIAMSDRVFVTVG